MDEIKSQDNIKYSKSFTPPSTPKPKSSVKPTARKLPSLHLPDGTNPYHAARVSNLIAEYICFLCPWYLVPEGLTIEKYV